MSSARRLIKSIPLIFYSQGRGFLDLCERNAVHLSIGSEELGGCSVERQHEIEDFAALLHLVQCEEGLVMKTNFARPTNCVWR